jgi:hypothetical protein
VHDVESQIVKQLLNRDFKLFALLRQHALRTTHRLLISNPQSFISSCGTGIEICDYTEALGFNLVQFGDYFPHLSAPPLRRFLPVGAAGESLRIDHMKTFKYIHKPINVSRRLSRQSPNASAVALEHRCPHRFFGSNDC